MEGFSGYTLAAVDLPGCGESSRPEDFSYTMKDQAELVLKWIKELGLTQIILVGHSMGGVICLHLAEALGAEVKAFFNLEGNLGFEDCTFSRKAASFSQQSFERYGFEGFKNRLKEMVKKDPSPGLGNYYQNILKAYARALFLSSISLVRESCEGELKERFLNLAVKKCYVFGERSTNSASRDFLDEHDIAHFVVPQSGHFMMDDQPDIFYEMLFDNLSPALPPFRDRPSPRRSRR